MEDSAETLRVDVKKLFADINDRLPRLLADASEDIFNDLEDERKRRLVENLQSSGVDLSRLAQMRKTGEFLLFVDADTAIQLFRANVDRFFNGGVWDEKLSAIEGVSADVLNEATQRKSALYLNWLDDVRQFLDIPMPSHEQVQRTRISLGLLTRKMR